MKKQIITVMAVAMFCATLAVASVRAQGAGNMSVNIPFDFTIAARTLPAGEYYLQRSIDGPRVVMQIRSRDKADGVYLPQTHPMQGGEIQAESKLVFNKYGNQYFLSQVWIAGRSSGEELTKTSREQLLRREIAARAIKRERVTVAAKLN